MKCTIGLDFGGSSTEIYVKGKGIVLREPSLAAVDPEGYVLSVGSEALLMRGRAPGSVTIRRPIRDSVVSDFNLTAEMLDRFLEFASKGGHKKVAVAVRCGIGEQNREMIRSALNDCRVSRVEFVESPLAAYYGANCDKSEDGVIVCDIGAGSVESAYVKDGEILRSEIYFGGGRDADKSICDYLRRKYGLSVTKIAAQAAKHKLTLLGDSPEPIEISGLDTTTGLPKRRAIPVLELLRCCAPQIKGAYDCISAVLSNLPRQGGEVSSVSRIVLVGGGAQLPGLDAYIAELTEREVVIPPSPTDTVAEGLGRMIEGIKK